MTGTSGCVLFNVDLLHLFLYVCGRMCYGAFMELRELAGADSLLPPWERDRTQGWQQTPLPTESSH